MIPRLPSFMRCAAVLLTLASCSPAHVQTQQGANLGPLPPPTGVVVEDFSVSPGQVALDQGVAARLRRAGGPAADAQAAAAAQTQATLAEELGARLATFGLPVMRLPPGAAPPPHSLLVRGQIVAIDEGNRTRRVLVGFGAGRSRVGADAQVYYVANAAPPELVQSFTADSNSGHMPGAVGTMGAGAVAGHLATSAALSGAAHGANERRRSTDQDNAIRIADALARQIATFAETQGWIPPGSVR